MQCQSIRMSLLSAVVLACPLLALAGGQPAKMRAYSKEELQDRTVITRAVQQGKGAGTSLSQAVIHANAYRSQTAEENSIAGDPPPAAHTNPGDSAFRK